MSVIAVLGQDHFTIDEVDAVLRETASVMRYASQSTRYACMDRIDQFLDIRLDLMGITINGVIVPDGI